jgi:hypothetical protein
MGGSPIPMAGGNSPQNRLNSMVMAQSPAYRGQSSGGPLPMSFPQNPGTAMQLQSAQHLGMPQRGAMQTDFRNIPMNYQMSHGGVAYHGANTMGPNAVQQARMNGPDPAAMQAEMQRRQAGANMGNANPGNAALSGYMMGQ